MRRDEAEPKPPPSERWKLHVEDVLEHMERIASYTRDMSLTDFENDEMTFDAVERNFIAIGESTKRIPEGLRKTHSEIPWSSFVETGEAKIHRYFERDAPSTWNAIHEDFPPLIPKLRHILESEG